MLIKFSRIICDIVLAFIVLLAIVNFSGYCLIKEFVKSEYVKKILIKQLSLNEKSQYQLNSDIKIHWNPFAFGLDVNNFYFYDLTRERLVINIKDTVAKFNIFSLINGTFVPNQIFISDVNIIIKNDKINTNSEKKNQFLSIIDTIRKIKVLQVINFNLDANDMEMKINKLIFSQTSNFNTLHLDIEHRKIGHSILEGNLVFNDKNQVNFQVLQSKVEIMNENDILSKFPIQLNLIKLNFTGEVQAEFNNNISIKNLYFNIFKINGEIQSPKINYEIQNGLANLHFDTTNFVLSSNYILFAQDKNKLYGDFSYFFNKTKRVVGKINLNKANLKNFINFTVIYQKINYKKKLSESNFFLILIIRLIIIIIHTNIM
jgi:hypothetical protein